MQVQSLRLFIKQVELIRHIKHRYSANART